MTLVPRDHGSGMIAIVAGFPVRTSNQEFLVSLVFGIYSETSDEPTGGTARSAGRGVLRAPTLTHRNKRGELYLRIEEVEEQIGVALSLGRGALLERAANRDPMSTGYLGPECSERMTAVAQLTSGARKRVWSWRVLQV
jgi:hypothetical protein